MLVPAINYTNVLKEKMNSIWFNEKYMYYNYDTYYSELEIDNETWNNHQFISLDKEDNIIGFIHYRVNRQTYNCYGLGIINFTNNKITFGNDLKQAINDIFEKFNFNKLNFTVVAGNPIEKSYDKMIKKYGGRIVGIYKNEIKLINGKYYDKKLYEITRDDYLKHKLFKTLSSIHKENDIMSEYVRYKSLRVPLEKYGVNNEEQLDKLRSKINSDDKFIIAPTEELFLDYVLEYDYAYGINEFGRARSLSVNEKNKYEVAFKNILNNINMHDVHLVEYCFYNCTEAPSYYDEFSDDFYKEI